MCLVCWIVCTCISYCVTILRCGVVMGNVMRFRLFFLWWWIFVISLIKKFRQFFFEILYFASSFDVTTQWKLLHHFFSKMKYWIRNPKSKLKEKLHFPFYFGRKLDVNSYFICYLITPIYFILFISERVEEEPTPFNPSTIFTFTDCHSLISHSAKLPFDWNPMPKLESFVASKI